MYISANKIKEFRERHDPGICPILQKPMKKTVVDHDHRTGEIRGVIDFNANNLLGVIERKFFSYCSGKAEDLPNVLRNIADFLERPRSGYLHPVGLNQLIAKFKGQPKENQINLLNSFYFVDTNEITLCNNQQDRVKLYRTLLKKFYETKVTKHRVGVQCSKDTVQ
jgi:hypothetical protein